MADKNIKAQFLTGTADVGNIDPDRSDAKRAYREAVREAAGSNDPDVAFKATKAFARRFRKTMQRLA